MHNLSTKEKPFIEVSLLEDWVTKEIENAQTTVFCNYISKSKYKNGGGVNIYPSTYLINGNESLPLLHAMNIPVAPNKHHFEKSGEFKRFVLIFPPVPKCWKSFDFVEACDTNEGFFVENISRNNSGIYKIQLT